MKKTSVIVFFITFISIINAQNNQLIDSILLNRKAFSLTKIERLIPHLESIKLKELFNSDIYYQKSGLTVNNSFSSEKESSLKNEAIKLYLEADLKRNSKQVRDTVSYKLYFKSLKIARKLKDTLLTNVVLPKINYYLFRNGNDLKTFKKYINLTENYAKDSIDLFWLNYYKIGYHLRNEEKSAEKISKKKYDSIFDIGLKYANTAYFKGYINQLKGIYYDAYLNLPEKALNYYNLAEKNYTKNDLFYSIKGVKSIQFNKAIIKYNLGDYNNSIKIFRKHLKTEQDSVYILYTNEWLYKNYNELKKNDSAYFYFKKMVEIKDALNPISDVVVIHDIESKYNIQEIETNLKSISDSNIKLRNKNNKTLIILLFLFVIALILGFYIKKIKTKKKKLTTEKNETLIKLEEIKNIVTKDYIVLKDKTKVYVSELIYIKSEDHYIKVFLNNGKSKLARGKLSTMNEQLPPNFARCHRSYIVNKNFIKQINSKNVLLKNGSFIPVSKTYQKLLHF